MTQPNHDPLNHTWLVVAKFEASPGLNDDALLNAIHEEIEKAGGTFSDEIIGNIAGGASGSLDDAYDAARGYLTAVVKRPSDD